MNRRFLLKMGKFALISLIVFLTGNLAYNEINNSESQNQLNERDPTIASIQSGNALKDSIVDYGMQLLGTPYVTAGSGIDGFDCSGFVYFVYQHFDINVPRSTAAYESFGREIPVENVQKGDLLLFLSPTRNAIGHIGIITNANGRESDFIHATSGRKMQVTITNLSNKGYTRRFVKAIRVL